MSLGCVKQGDQVVAADVEDFVPLFQHGIEVGILYMTDPGNGRRNRRGAVGVHALQQRSVRQGSASKR